MKSTTIPPVRVTPEVRAEIEAALRDGETLSEFVRQAALEVARRRRAQQEFIRLGLQRLADPGDRLVPADEVVARLGARIGAARERLSAKR